MDDTPNLNLPYIMAAQAQKHVTHNEAIRALDAVVQISVADRDLTAPPASPTEGDRYIVAAGATGAWAANDGKIAAWQDGAWMFYSPLEGWLAWIADEDALVVWDGSGWTVAGGGASAFTDLADAPSAYAGAAGKLSAVKSDETGLEFADQVPLLGVNATPDATNKLAVTSAASLFNHAGAGHQHKINKNAAADTASLLFQTDFSGRAEFGTTGDDDWHVKVSPDGSTWHEAIVVDKDTGDVGVEQAIRTSSYLRVGSQSAPTNTDAGDLTAERLSVGDSGLPTGGIAIFTGTNPATSADASAGISCFLKLAPPSNSSADFRSLNMETQPNASGIDFNTVEAGFFANRVVNSGAIAFASGVQAYGFQLGSSSATMGTVSQVAGVRAQAVNSFSNALTATINAAYAVYVTDSLNGGSGPLTIAKQAGIAISGLGAGTNNTSLLMGTTSIPSGNWGIYNVLSDPNYFAGDVGIGTASPSTKLHVNGPVRLGSYTVAGVPSPSASGAGAVVYISDESGGAVLAFSDGTNWRRSTDRAVIS